jgi:Methylase involved in ubiquinone/menaquinone biosynthesis
MNNSYFPKIGERVEVAARYVKKCNTLLDVGCGDGVIALFLRRRVSKIYGIDKSERVMKIAKKRGMFVQKIDLDKEKLPFSNLYFDFVTCLDVVEHVRDPHGLIREIYRVLKKGGTLIITAPNIRFSDHLVRLILNGHFPITSEDKSAYDGGHIHYFTFSDLRDILQSEGFRVVKEEGIINKPKRGIRGKIGEIIMGKKFMREFRSPGILIVAQKPK